MAAGYLLGQVPLLAFRGLYTDLAAAGTSIKCGILLATFTPNQDTMTSYADVTAYEQAATGNYVKGGVVCGNKTLTYSSRATTFDLANPYWASLTLSAIRYLFFMDATPATDAAKKLIALYDLGATISVAASPVQFNVPSSGLFVAVVGA
jgi:hypothetical protein